MDTLRIMQRFHSLFYTPQFVALHLGVFAEEDLRLELSTATSGTELSTRVLSGAAELGVSGPLRTLELAEEGARGS